MPSASTPILALNIHAGFECRRSGACCTAGWPIPVEPEGADAIHAWHLLEAGALRADDHLPEEAVAILRPRADATCPAFDKTNGNACVIHRQLGHDRLPAACRFFPRVALLEPDAVRVTLSHFCPTVAWMLWRDDVSRVQTTADAAGIADRAEHDGFDARQTIPPFIRPGVAADPGTCRTWEQHLLEVLNEDHLTPEEALSRLASSAEVVRGWKAGPTSLAEHTEHVVTAAREAQHPAGGWTMTLRLATPLYAVALESVPHALKRPAIPDPADAADREWVRPGWSAHARPIRRYLAARSFGAWSAYLGQGLRTQVAMLAIALAVVRVEAARETGRVSRPLDDALLHAAVRSADLLLHHLSDPPALVRSLGRAEQGSLQEFLTTIGLEKAP